MGNENNKCLSLPCRWSGGVLAVTIITIVVSLVTVFYFEYKVNILWYKYLMIALLLLTIIVSLYFMPLRLKADSEKIVLKRLFYPLEIPINEIVEIKQISKIEIGRSIRTFGSGGFFGFLGRFRNELLGNYLMYVTEFNNLILIRTENKKYVFCCYKSDKFVEFVTSKSSTLQS